MISIKSLLKIVCALFFIAGLTVAALFYVFETKQGQAWLFSVAKQEAEKHLNAVIHVESYSVSFPATVKLDNISLQRDGKTLFTAKEFAFDISLIDLTLGRINIPNFFIEELVSEALPSPLKIQGHFTLFSDRSWSLEAETPQLLVGDLQASDITALIIHTGKMKDRASLTLQFHVQNMPWNVQSIVNWSEREKMHLSSLAIELPHAQLEGHLTVALSPLSLSGDLAGKIDDMLSLAGAPIESTGEIEVHLAPREGSTFLQRQAFHLRGKAKIKEELQFALEGNLLKTDESLQWNIQRFDGEIAHIPFRLTAPFYATLTTEQFAIKEAKLNWGGSEFRFSANHASSWDIALQGSGRIDPYLPLFGEDNLHFTGDFVFHSTWIGPLDNLATKGELDISRGAYEDADTGMLYSDIQGHIQATEKELKLTEFSALDHKGGRIVGSGRLEIDPEKHFPFDVQILPSHIYIIDSDFITLSASGKLNLLGNALASTLSGELVAEQAEIHIDRSPPLSIKHVDIKTINGEGDAEVTNDIPETSHIVYNLTLKAPGNVHASGGRVTSLWKGSVDVRGTPDAPLLFGDLRLTEGALDLNGRLFPFTQGNIHFAGAPDKKISLYVVASKDFDQMTAEIIVKGPANHPVFSFRSNPPLSQREILSYILFNHGIRQGATSGRETQKMARLKSDISSAQGEQLLQSFIDLSLSDKSSNSADFLSRLRERTGLDTLDLAPQYTGEGQDFGLSIGKQITENIKLTINQGVTSISPVIAIEAKLHKNLKFQADTGVGADAPIRTSLKWKKDY